MNNIWLIVVEAIYVLSVLFLFGCTIGYYLEETKSESVSIKILAKSFLFAIFWPIFLSIVFGRLVARKGKQSE